MCVYALMLAMCASESRVCVWKCFLVTAVTDLHFCQASLKAPETDRGRFRGARRLTHTTVCSSVLVAS